KLRFRIEEKERVRLKEQKMMEEDNRVRLETEKMLRLEEDKRERITPAKRSQVSGDSSLYYRGKTYRMAEMKRPCYGLKEPDMMELIKDLRPWVEDLSRRYSDMNKVHLSDAFDLFLGKPGPLISTSSNYYFKKPCHCGMLMGRDTIFHGAMLTSSLLSSSYRMTSQDSEPTRCGDLVDVNKTYEMAELHGILEVFVCHIPQVFLVEYYVKSKWCDENDDEVTPILRTHEKKDYFSMPFEELVVWQEEEANSSFYLRSPLIKPKNDLRQFKGKALFDDFKDVANDVVVDDFDDVAKNNVCGSSSSNKML
nr:phospholipase-like protein [Tanacetum cinerariifolium]